jgi:16S rRNA A1518/A1519 N6-dimethyltransferase RsmA/KsgA/DIM1 with predicted DNA glycosylase/AP lyase activity
MIELYPTYRELYKHNPVMARKALIKVKNISLVSRLFRTTRKTVRKALQRYTEHKDELLKDLSRRPRHSPNKTPPHIEVL